MGQKHNQPEGNPTEGWDSEQDKWLGDKLRQVYDDVLNEPLPDAFGDLLSQLDDADRKKPKNDNSKA